MCPGAEGKHTPAHTPNQEAISNWRQLTEETLIFSAGSIKHTQRA